MVNSDSGAGSAGNTTRLWLARNLLPIGTLLIVAILAGSAMTVWKLREAALHDVRAELHAKGVAIAEQTARAVQAVDLVLQNLQAKVAAFAADGPLRGNPTLMSREFQLDMNSFLRNLPQVDGMSVIDPQGELIAFSRAWPAPRISLADRDLYLYLRDHDDPTTFVSPPVRNRASQAWTFFLARRINGPGHSFAGIVVCTLPLAYFEDFFRAVTDNPEGVIALIRRDGVLLAHYPAMDEMNGKRFPPYAAWPGLVAAGGGLYVSGGTASLPPRLVEVRPLQLYPLVVDVGLARDAALAPWRRTACVVGLIALVASVGFGLLFRVLAAQFRAIDRQRLDHLATARALARSERQLQENARDLELTVAAMDEGVMMVNAGHRVVICNPRAVDLLGLPPDLVAEQPPFERILQHQWEHNEFSRTASSLVDFIRSGGLLESPRRYERIRPDGTILEIHTSELPGGGIVRTFIDITERRAAEEMRAARDEADRASRAKSEFLATMSHEIRSPMSGLLGVLELLRETGLDADQKRMADMVHNSASILLAVLNDILDFSKIEAGALAIETEPVELRPLLEELVQPHALAAAQKGLPVTLRVAAGVSARVGTDKLRLRQILGNLLSNAIKFTASGEVALVVMEEAGPAAPGDDAGAWLRFVVRDSGIGMDEDVLARLFNPFTQADPSTTRNFGGTGLGLSISRRLAHLLGGDLRVTSRPGVGSEFALLLPMRPCAEAPQMPAGGGGGTIAKLPSGCHVLVVDDDPTIRWLSQRQLETLGCRADVVRSAEAALERLDVAEYDLVLTDCHMPGMDGAALTRTIRAAADQRRRCLPVIGLTADVTETQRVLCQTAGMNALAIKPLTVARLSHLLAEHLPAGHLGSASPDDALALRSVAFDAGIYQEIFPPRDPQGAAWLGEGLDALRRDVGALSALVHAGTVDTPAVAAVAHRLAGAAFSLGAMLLGQAARVLEHAAVAGERPALAERFAVVEAELGEARRAIGVFMGEATAEVAA